MGKVRTRFLGVEEIEKEQKSKSKERAKRKKVSNTPSANDTLVDSPQGENSSRSSLKGGDPQNIGSEGVKISKKKKQSHQKGKKYKAAQKQVDTHKTYRITQAVELLKKMSYASFDESVEIHMNTTEKNLRGEVSFPHATGRSVTVAIVDDALLEAIEKGELNFDILIAHPSYMPKIAKYAKILGPKGLMPNPKAGTISTEPEKVAEKFKKGTLSWKSESKFPLIHQSVAKLSADTADIEENIQAFIGSVGAKNIKDVYISASMTPSVRIEH